MFTQFDKLPTLETPCARCEMHGLVYGYRGEEQCPECHGAGYIPTDIGKQILELVLHVIHRAVPEQSNGANQSVG